MDEPDYSDQSDRSDVNRPSAVHKSVGSGFIRRAGWAGGYRLRLLDPCSRLQDICHRECFTRRAYRMDSRCPSTGADYPTGVLIFSYKPASVVITEAAVAASAPSSAFRLYVEKGNT